MTEPSATVLVKEAFAAQLEPFVVRDADERGKSSRNGRGAKE